MSLITLFWNRADWDSVAQVITNLPWTILTRTVSDNPKTSEKMTYLGIEPGETLNMTRVGDDSKFLNWAKSFKLDIGTRS